MGFLYESEKDNDAKSRQRVNQRFVRLMVLIGICIFGVGLVVHQDSSSAALKGVSLRTVVSFSSGSSKDAIEKLLYRAKLARSEAVTQLKIDYGEEYFNKLFVTESGESIGKTIFTSPKHDPKDPEYDIEDDDSRFRFVQGLMKKIVQAQLKQEPRFVWATGGHSAAAGHGNFHNESFTAFMERTSKNMFAAVGIDMEARNYAMGGMRSAPELALCNEAVYGNDADVLTWDFSMTEGNNYWATMLYGHRAGIHRNRPALFEFDATQPKFKHRLENLATLEGMGMATFAYRFEDALYEKLPDMQIIVEPEEIDAIPEFVRHFKCGEQLETGDPSCAEHKYTPVDYKIKGRVSWHPGWKFQALKGNMIALFLMDALEEALIELIDMYNDNPDISPLHMLEVLQEQQGLDYEKFQILGKDKLLDSPRILEEKPEEYNVLLRNRALCHTGLLPSKSRYLGISSNTPGAFYEGSSAWDEPPPPTNGESEWRLVFDPNEHHMYSGLTNRTVLIDYKDWYQIDTANGASSLVLPNQAELDAYLEKEPLKQASLIVMCLATCPWGKCAKGTMGMEDINDGNVTISVNDQRVSKVEDLGKCLVFQNENEKYEWQPNSNGQYKVTVQVHPAESFLKVSSVIIL